MICMFDFQRAGRPSGWITEQQGCSDWFNSTHKAVSVDLLERPDEGRFLQCKDLPQIGETISEYGEYGSCDDYPYEVTKINMEDEIIVAKNESEQIEISFEDLYCMNGRPMWNTVWDLYSNPTYEEIKLFNDCGIGVYEDEDSDWYIGIDGCGYDFFDAHWLKLYRKMGLQWHTTEESWLRELRFRTQAYCHMCADIPSWRTYQQRSEVLAKMADRAMNQKRLSRRATFVMLPYRIKHLWHVVKDWFSFDTKASRKVLPSA